MGRLLLFSGELSNTTHLKTRLPPSPERITFNFKGKVNYQRVEKLSRLGSSLVNGSRMRKRLISLFLSPTGTIQQAGRIHKQVKPQMIKNTNIARALFIAKKYEMFSLVVHGIVFDY
jgi:hypothetical protein